MGEEIKNTNPTWMWHKKLAPDGEIKDLSDVPELIKKGWVDAPHKLDGAVPGK